MLSEKAAITEALQANKDHQYSLKVYTERLENELKSVDKMIAAIESDDDSVDVPEAGSVSVDGGAKPVSVLMQRTLLSEDSPFFEDAQWRKRYEERATVNQMKAKEHDALREAVRVENMRMHTLQAHSRHQPTDLNVFPAEYFDQNIEGIDWRRVSIKMSSLIPSAISRSAKECEIRWLGYLHPSNNNAAWSTQETERLRGIIAEEETATTSTNWQDVSRKLGTNRTPLDCMRHGMTRRAHTWTSEADLKLLEAVQVYGLNNWQLVAMNVSEDATAHQCQKRYFDTLDPLLKTGVWTAEEDEKLRRAIAAFSGSSSARDGSGTSGSGKTAIPWQDVALFVPGRTNNQCREHYQDYILKSEKRSKDNGKGKWKAVVANYRIAESGSEGVNDVALDSQSTNTQSSIPKPRPKPRRKAKRGSKSGPAMDIDRVAACENSQEPATPSGT